MRKIIAALLVLLSTTGCGKETDTMDQEKQAVMQVFEAMQQAMIDKDLDTCGESRRKTRHSPICPARHRPGKNSLQRSATEL